MHLSWYVLYESLKALFALIGLVAVIVVALACAWQAYIARTWDR